MAPTLELIIISPERELLRETVDEVLLPTTTGEIGVLPNHMPLVTQLAAGELTVKIGRDTRHIAIHGGFAEISAAHIRVLADAAELAEELDERRAEEARKRAEQALADAKDHTQFAEASAALARALARLKVARRKHRH